MTFFLFYSLDLSIWVVLAVCLSYIKTVLVSVFQQPAGNPWMKETLNNVSHLNSFQKCSLIKLQAKNHIGSFSVTTKKGNCKKEKFSLCKSTGKFGPITFITNWKNIYEQELLYLEI